MSAKHSSDVLNSLNKDGKFSGPAKLEDVMLMSKKGERRQILRVLKKQFIAQIHNIFKDGKYYKAAYKNYVKTVLNYLENFVNEGLYKDTNEAQRVKVTLLGLVNRQRLNKNKHIL